MKKKATAPRSKTTIADRKARLQSQIKMLETREQIKILRDSLKKK